MSNEHIYQLSDWQMKNVHATFLLKKYQKDKKELCPNLKFAPSQIQLKYFITHLAIVW